MKGFKSLALAGTFSVAAHLGLGVGLQYSNTFSSPPPIVLQESGNDSEHPAESKNKEEAPDRQQPSAFSFPSHLAIPEAEAAAFLFPKLRPSPFSSPELPKENVSLYQASPLPAAVPAIPAVPTATDVFRLKMEKPLPLEQILIHPQESSTLPELYQAREQFQKQLLIDMTDDPAGEVKLDSLPFIDFFVRSWYLDEAIKQMEDGKSLVPGPEKLYRRFDQMLALANSKMESDDSPLEKSVKFHAAMMSFLRGYERDTRDMRNALQNGVINCDSGTKLGLSGYTLFDPEARVNVFTDHIQSVTTQDGQELTIENTTPFRPIGVRHRGLLVKPEVYVVGYLLLNDNASVSDFPEEVQEWYGYPFPNFLGLYEPFFFGGPITMEFSGIKKPGAGFRAFDQRPSFGDSTIHDEYVSLDLTRAGSGISQVVHERSSWGWEDVRTPLEEQIDRIKELQETYQQADMARLRENIQRDVTSALSSVEYTILRTDIFKFRELSRQFEYAEGYDLPQRFLPQPPPEKFPKVQTIPAEVRDADPANYRIGLLQDLKFQGVTYFRIPSVDWCQLAKELIDNTVVLYGTDSYQRWKGIQQRQLGVQRALLFGQGCQGLGDLLEQRLDILLAAVSGKHISLKTSETFSSHAGWQDNPLRSLSSMLFDGGTLGLSSAALDDLVSFRGEQKAIDAVGGYLGRTDVLLDHISYGQLLVALQYRLTDEGVTSLCAFLKENVSSKEVLLEARVGMGQFMHRSCRVQEKTEEKIAQVLEEYLHTRNDWRREEILQLVANGLPSPYATSHFAMSLYHHIQKLRFGGELQQEYEAVNKRVPWSVDDNSFLAMMHKIMKEWNGLTEDYEILAALGASEGYSLLRSSYFVPPKDVEQSIRSFPLPKRDLATLLVRHGQAVDEIIADYWKNVKEPEIVPFSMVDLLSILVSEGQVAKAEQMLKEVTTGDYEFRQRLSAAVGLYGLGKTVAGSKAMTDIAVEGCISPGERDRLLQAQIAVVEGRKTEDSLYGPPKEGRSLFIPTYFLAKYGITTEDQQRLVKAAEEKKLCFPSYIPIPSNMKIPYNHPSSADVTVVGNSTLRDLLPQQLYREEFLAAAQEYLQNLQQLGITDQLIAGAIAYPEDGYWGLTEMPAIIAGLSHPLHRAAREKTYDPVPHGLETILSFFSTFEPRDVEVLKECSQSLLFNNCENLLVLRGYLGLDQFGLPTMYNPPQPIPLKP